MNIAYLICAHTDIVQLKRLSLDLVRSGDVYIHIDKKVCDINYIAQVHSLEKQTSADVYKIIFVKERIAVYWGGWSQVKVQRLLLKNSIGNKNRRYDRFVFLSGLCYPIMSPNQLKAEFEAHPQKQYLNAFNMSIGAYGLYRKRFCGYHLFRDTPLWFGRQMKRCLVAGVRDLLWNIHIRKPDYILRNGIHENVFYGGSWIALNRECAKYVYDNMQEDSEYVQYFKTCYACDELCIHTIVMNSPFACFSTEVKMGLNNTPTIFQELSPLHKLHYDKAIKVYTEQDYDEIVRSGKMFVRKIVSGVSDGLVKKLDLYKSRVL